MKPVYFLEEARTDFDEIVDYYNMRQKGIGDELHDNVLESVEVLSRFPQLAPSYMGYRALTLTHFPYRVIYGEMEDHLFIIAVAHTSRRPDYWRDRLPGAALE